MRGWQQAQRLASELATTASQLAYQACAAWQSFKDIPPTAAQLRALLDDAQQQGVFAAGGQQGGAAADAWEFARVAVDSSDLVALRDAVRAAQGAAASTSNAPAAAAGDAAPAGAGSGNVQLWRAQRTAAGGSVTVYVHVYEALSLVEGDVASLVKRMRQVWRSGFDIIVADAGAFKSVLDANTAFMPTANKWVTLEELVPVVAWLAQVRGPLSLSEGSTFPQCVRAAQPLAPSAFSKPTWLSAMSTAPLAGAKRPAPEGEQPADE